MKRIMLAFLGTVAGLVGLLSFKSHGHPVGAGGTLPSAALPGSSDSTGTSGAPATRPSAPQTSSAGGKRTIIGDAIETPYGVVQIKLTVSGNKIAQVSYVQLTAFDQRSQQINTAAAPILLQETLSAQSANIDTVSGATFTSDGYVQSLQSALDRAGI